MQIPQAPGQFLHPLLRCPGPRSAARDGGTGNFEFDRGLDVPLVVANDLQRFCDRRVPFAELHVLVVECLVFHVNVGDAIVVLLQERHRRCLVAAREMPEIEVGAVVLAGGKRLLPVLRTGFRVTVVADHHLVLLGEQPEPLELRGPLLLRRGRDLGRDRSGPERLAQAERVVEDIVGEAKDAIDLDDLDGDTCVVIELLEFRRPCSSALTAATDAGPPPQPSAPPVVLASSPRVPWADREPPPQWPAATP